MEEKKKAQNQEIHKLGKEEINKKVSGLQEKTRVQMIDKIFMTISDVDREDAAYFKKFCDENVSGKQFLGIKVIRTIMERLDPLVKNILTQINELTERVRMLENQPEEEEKEQGVVIPKTQGSPKVEK